MADTDVILFIPSTTIHDLSLDGLTVLGEGDTYGTFTKNEARADPPGASDD